MNTHDDEAHDTRFSKIVIRYAKQARNTKHIPGVFFVCDDCKRELPVQTQGGTGYGYYEQGDYAKCICYECCGKRDMKAMRETGKATLYLTTHKDGTAEVTNWPGTLKLRGGYRKGHHNMAGSRYDAWFVFEGQQWHGVQYGDNTQILHCKRLKTKH